MNKTILLFLAILSISVIGPRPADPATPTVKNHMGNAVKYVHCGTPQGIYPILEVVLNQRMTFTYQTPTSIVEIWLNPAEGTSTITETDPGYSVTCIISTGKDLNFSDVPDSIFLKDQWVPYDAIFKQQKG